MGPETVVVSGSYGAGHDAAADALTHQLRSAGHVVRRLDVAEELPWRIGEVLRWLYFAQLRLFPHSWGTTLRLLEGDGVVFRMVRRLLGLLGRRLTRQVVGAGLIVSTHPFASQALGQARARGELDSPVATYLTDVSVHRLWVHPAVDLHLAIHQVAAEQARALGGTTSVVRPVVARSPDAHASGWRPPWQAHRPAALVVGGSCGVGQLEASALDILASGIMTPVVACGTNDRLRDRLEGIPGVVALGWRDDMSALVAAAACVVQNAGGMTSLEAMAAGTPTITYRAIPGHGITNAQGLDAAGLAPWVLDTDELGATLTRILVSPEPSSLPTDAPPVVEVLARHFAIDSRPALAAA